MFENKIDKHTGNLIWNALNDEEKYSLVQLNARRISELENRMKELESHCHEINNDQTSKPVMYEIPEQFIHDCYTCKYATRNKEKEPCSSCGYQYGKMINWIKE